MEVRKFLTQFFLCLAVAFFSCGCGVEGDSDLSNKFTDKNKIKICLITMDKEVPYWEEIDKGCQKAVEESGIVDYEWLGPFERDENMQCECIDKAVADGAKVILISAVPGETVNVALEKAGKAGVKIIYVDNAAKYAGVVSLMTDNENAGKTAGQTMLAALQKAGIKSGTVGIISNSPDMLNTSLRDRGFRQAFQGSGFVVAPTIYASGNPNVVMDSVKEHPDYVGFFGANQTSTLLIGEQVKNSAKKQIVVGFDTAEKTLQLIRDGAIYATMKQNTEKMGREGIESAVKVMTGKYDDNNAVIDTGVTVITKDNLSQIEN